jgi:D-alanyl-D-alanine carboxypeptidase
MLFNAWGGLSLSRWMMKVLAAAVLLVSATAFASSVKSSTAGPTTTGAASAVGLSPATKDAAKQYLEKFIVDNNIPGVLIQVTTPAGSWSEALGKANKSPSTRMSMDLQHRIGSVTKTFTTTLILQLAQQGKLSLDDPVSKFVPGVANGDKITLRMLGNMTSGLHEYLANPEFRTAFFKDPSRTWKPQELLEASYKQEPQFAPGTNSAYSNPNTVLLGLVVEKVEGRSFAEVLKEKILVPQGLNHTFFSNNEQFPGRHIHGYTSLYPGKKEVDSTSWSPSQAYAAGAMISTIADLTKWAKIVATGALISPELQAERLKWDRLGDNDDNWHYTFGLEENSGWIGHNGQIPGHFTFEIYNPKLDATIVIAMNSDKNVNGEPGVNVLLRGISKILFPNNPVNVPVIK